MAANGVRTVPERLPDGAPMARAPENEQGVVYLFSHLARRFGLRVERVQAGFPDCIATRAGKRVRIEFEYRSRNFAQHRHDPSKCDWIVCWIHDWPTAPERLRVVELRKEYGLGFNVWFQPVGKDYRDRLTSVDHGSSWSVPSQASQGDLVLFYRTAPERHVRDLFLIERPVRKVNAGWRKGQDWMAPIRRVATLRSPVHLSQLREHRVLGTAGFVRGRMQGRYRATPYWPELYRLILELNPGLERLLREYEPSRVL